MKRISQKELQRQRLASAIKKPDKVILDRKERTKTVIRNGVTRVVHAWDHINLSKAERKGKTPDQIQQLRKDKYLARYVNRAER